MRNVVTIPHNSIAVPTRLLYPFLFPYSSRSFDFVHAACTPFEKGYGSCVCFDRFIGQCDGFVRSVALLLLFSAVLATRSGLVLPRSAAALVRIMWEGNFMEFLIALIIAIPICIAMNQGQKERKEEQHNALSRQTQKMEAEGVQITTVYTFQNLSYIVSEKSGAIGFRFIVDNTNHQIAISDDILQSVKTIPFDKIISCEVYTDSEVTGGVGRAVVGGVVSGGVGAIIGATTAKKHITSYKIIIYTNDILSPSVTLDLITKKTPVAHLDYQRAVPFAQQVCASIKAIIANQ